MNPSNDELDSTERAALDTWVPLKPPIGFAERVVAARNTAPPRRWRGVALAAAAVVATAAAVVAVMFAMTTPTTQPIATVSRADGWLERQRAEQQQWGSITVGGEIERGDAVRTGLTGAELLVIGGAKIAMREHTMLRFGSRDGRSKISVELGVIDLSGEGSLALDVGDVRLSRGGTVRVTGGQDGKTKLELVFGEAQVAMLNGQTINLELGIGIDIGLAIGLAVVTAVPDAAVTPPADAAVAVAVASGEPTITVTGAKAEVQLPGETAWQALASGPLAIGAKVRIGRETTARLEARGTTLELASGSRAAVTAETVVVDTGNARVITGRASVPGGAIAVAGNDAETRIEVGTSTRIVVQRGAGTVTGTNDAKLEMIRGESATLMRSGQIRPLEAIPSYFDMRILAGDGNFTIHDPRPPTAVQFQFASKCAQGGIIEMDRDARFRTAKVSAGKEFANHLVKSGLWHYRLRCTAGGVDGNAVASGRIVVVADAGSRRLPVKPGASPFTPNGMGWKLGYQSVVPDLAVTFPGGGGNFVLHLARGGKDLTFPSPTNKLKIPGKDLSEGSYTYWFDRDGTKQDKVGSLVIQFDQTAPQVYIELPVNGKLIGDDIEVRGAVLPGWTAAVDSASIPIDGARRFSAKVGRPAGNALAIRLSHPQRGVHFYLRRAK